jgi:hypothetical protein
VKTSRNAHPWLRVTPMFACSAKSLQVGTCTQSALPSIAAFQVATRLSHPHASQNADWLGRESCTDTGCIHSFPGCASSPVPAHVPPWEVVGARRLLVEFAADAVGSRSPHRENIHAISSNACAVVLPVQASRKHARNRVLWVVRRLPRTIGQ